MSSAVPSVRRSGGLDAWLLELWRDHTGATAIEYGALIALIAIALGVAAVALGSELAIVFDQVTDVVAASESGQTGEAGRHGRGCGTGIGGGRGGGCGHQ